MSFSFPRHLAREQEVKTSSSTENKFRLQGLTDHNSHALPQESETGPIQRPGTSGFSLG